MKVDRAVARRQRLNASLVYPQAPPYTLWSFHGSSYEWGKDDVKEVSANFSAIAKDGRMYYSFFAPVSSPWKGEVELRGLAPGKYRVYD